MYNLKEFNPEIHKKNLEKIETLISRIENPIILLAFGGNIMNIAYLKICLIDIHNLL